MTRLAICSALALISIAASACATQQVASRDTQDIRDRITAERIKGDRESTQSFSPAGPF